MLEHSDTSFLHIVRLGFSYLQGLFDCFHKPEFRKICMLRSTKHFQGSIYFTGSLLASCERECSRFLFLCFYFFCVLFSQKLLKMHLKKPCKKYMEIFCENSFSQLDGILQWLTKYLRLILVFG